MPDMPESFQRLARLFHQDVFDDYGTLEAAAEKYIAGFKAPELRAIDTYLSHLLSREDSRNGLKNHWRKLNNDLYFGNTKSVVGFYSMLHLHTHNRLEILKSGG